MLSQSPGQGGCRNVGDAGTTIPNIDDVAHLAKDSVNVPARHMPTNGLEWAGIDAMSEQLRLPQGSLAQELAVSAQGLEILEPPWLDGSARWTYHWRNRRISRPWPRSPGPAS